MIRAATISKTSLLPKTDPDDSSVFAETRKKTGTGPARRWGIAIHGMLLRSIDAGDCPAGPRTTRITRISESARMIADGFSPSSAATSVLD